MGRADLFEIKNVSFSYGNLPALTNLSLEIETQSFCGILGPNGCGKTTLLDLMARINLPVSGRINFRGKNINDYARRILAREIALVPQNFYINFPFTIKEVVLMGRHPYIHRFGSASTEDRAIVAQAMRIMDIEQFQDKYVTELSGGEKQRVVFARAFAQDTPVIILDEGTSSMDIHHTLKLLDLVRQSVRQKNKTVIAAMHDLNLAAVFCDRIILMKAGKIVATGRTEEVLNEENIRKVFDVDAKISFDAYSGARQVVYRI
jgi:iron complex transport system ATP-binding protein